MRLRKQQDAMPAENLVKVRFNLDPLDWHGRPSETLWAEPKIGSEGTFLLRNSPFFVRGVSFLDLIFAQPGPEEMNFVRVLEHSGHSTYMLLVPSKADRFAEYWDELGGLGCSYESKSLLIGDEQKTLYSVDLPPTSNVYNVYSLLEKGERDQVWMFQEGHACLKK